MREPHRAYIVALMADLTRFRGFAETADPEVLFEKLGEYHAAVGKTVDSHGGRIIDYAGDAVFAVFNDPQMIDEPERHALTAAVELRDRFGDLSERWAREGHRMGLRIGLDAGFATLGRIGYEGHYSYGAIGRVVIAATLIAHQGRTGQIFVSQRLASAVDRLVVTRDAIEVQDPGLAQPLKVVEILGLRVPA